MTNRLNQPKRSALRSLALALVGSTILCWATEAGSTSCAIAEYPEAILRLTGNRQPFAPARVDASYEFSLKKLVAAQRGIHYGSAIRLTVDPLGEKLFLVDTAARGLLLKSADLGAKDVVRVPEWVLPGPGLQTGIFRLLGRLSWREFSMEPAVAELFQGKGFPWVDGIISTELFSPWRVRLDLRRNRLSLLPYPTSGGEARTECEARLDRNWWIITANARSKPAHLLLDSGASQTYFGEEWILRNFGDITKHQRPVIGGEGKYYEAGLWEISIPGAAPTHVSCLHTGPGQMPLSTNLPIDGVLGFDAMRELVLEFDYKAGKMYLLR